MPAPRWSGRRSTNAAEAEGARLAYILEELPIGVFIAEGDTDGENFHWTLINRAGQQQFGAATTTPGVVSETYTVMHPDGRPYAEEELPLQYAVRTGQDVPEQEILFRFHNGEERTILSTIRLLREQGSTGRPSPCRRILPSASGWRTRCAATPKACRRSTSGWQP